MLNTYEFILTLIFPGNTVSRTNIIRKKSKCVGVITKLRHFVPRQGLLSIFQSLTLPYLAKVLKSMQQIIDN